MFKSCSICGRIHPVGKGCKPKRIYGNTRERELRATYSWTEKSKEIRDHAQYLCEVCRDQNVFTYDNLEVHHITPIHENESLLLDNENLICLCPECHTKADQGQIDRDYLRELARKRESGEPPAEGGKSPHGV